MRDSFISLGDIIAFVFATAGIYKFVMAMKALVAWKKKAAIATWAEAAAEAAKKAIAGPASWVVLGASAAVAGGAMMALKAATAEKHAHGGFTTGGMSSFAEEGAEGIIDPATGRMQVVGMEGAVSGRPPVNAEVINNAKLTNMVAKSTAGGGREAAATAAVASSVNNMGSKLDKIATALEGGVNSTINLGWSDPSNPLGAVINAHLGEEGSQPISLKG